MDTTYSLEHVANKDLLRRLKDLVGRSNQLTSLVLAHLAEVEVRGIYRECARSSLYSYCIYELRMSADEAQRRILAARASRRFPIILKMVETGAIHLTGIVLLAPYLTDENHAELLARARFRTKREIRKLIAQVAPRPDVPAIIEPLGPTRKCQAPTWTEFTDSLRGPVHHLPSGNGPGEAPAPSRLADDDTSPALNGTASHAPERVTKNDGATSPQAEDGARTPATGHAQVPAFALALAPSEASPPQRYRIQFTADQRYVELLEQARDLLQHQIVDRDIAVVHLRAMEALVEKLRKHRCAATSRPRPRGERPSSDKTSSERPRSRHIPADVRRQVWKRDAGQCAFVDKRGVRCPETAGLELHHRNPYFRGGPPSVKNIALFCRAHNALAAERELGRHYIAQRIEERHPVP